MTKLEQEARTHVRRKIEERFALEGETLFFYPSVFYRPSARARKAVSVNTASIMRELGAKPGLTPNTWRNPRFDK